MPEESGTAPEGCVCVCAGEPTAADGWARARVWEQTGDLGRRGGCGLEGLRMGVTESRVEMAGGPAAGCGCASRAEPSASGAGIKGQARTWAAERRRTVEEE